MKTRHAWMLLLLAAQLRADSVPARHPGKTFGPPKPNHPWQHAETGLRFPHEVGGMLSEARFEYEDKELGTMLRYVSDKERIRADIFIYPCKAPHTTAKEMMQAATDEAGNVLGEILAAQKQGAYSDVKEGEATYKEIDLLPEGAGKSCLLALPLTLTIHEADVAGQADTQVRSLATLSVYQGHFVKIRCTSPAEQDKKLKPMIEEFVKQVQWCLLEPGLREVMRGEIRAYRADPLSARAREAAGSVVAFAEKTPMFSFKVSPALLRLAEEAKPAFSEAETDVLRAFIVGAVAAGIQEPPPEEPDFEQAGAAEVAKLHELMKQQKPALKNGLMEELARAAAKGEARAWLDAQDKAE